MYYLQKVENYLNQSDINLKSRKHQHLFRRYYLMGFLNKKTDLIPRKIGKIFGKDRTTVLNALKEIPYLENMSEYIEINQELSFLFPMSSPFEGESISNNQTELVKSLQNLQNQFLKSHGIN